ncbi:MAG TPA: glutathione-independent formaldehyde dehydrogenase [Chloroflexota bacterium]|nr:glutathione-independent formaldehyde dehydrogenase [Chloroflexota bacterium]
MKAVVYKGPRRMVVENVPDPRLEDPRDAIVKVTSAAICGSDLHFYDGCTVTQPGFIPGHEIEGVVAEIGSGVHSIKVGDRVVMPFNIACGYCFNCVRGYPNACLTTNPQGAGAGYGYPGLGGYQGGQAEYVRVPFADYGCLKLPGQPGDQWEDDFVLLADIFPTGFHATVLANVQEGASVAIYGAGPVGLLATLSARLRGAGEVYTVDAIPERLQCAKQLGATPIDASQGDPADQILDLRQKNTALKQGLLPGEEKMKGVLCGIDAVGYEAIDYWDAHQRQSNIVLEQLIHLVAPTGHLGIIGVYRPEDPCGQTEAIKHGELPIGFGEMWYKGQAVGTGQTPVARYNRLLRDLIVNGRAKPSVIVTQRLPLDGAPEAYAKFCERAPGYVKVVLKPGLAA